MPTSSYMPDVSVEIAFDSGFGTPAASRTWTDVSAYVELAEGLNITWGRGDERSTADANQLSLTLDNLDGRFTAGRSASPYYPNVKLDRPIRVTADPVDGSASVRFLGYINEWPTEWNETSAYAKAAITASSRLSRLGMIRAMRSLIETEMLADSPVAYYPLGEPSGSTQAADVSGTGKAPLTLAGTGTPVVFGNATGPGTDSLTAAEFADEQWLMGGDGLLGTGALTVETFFSSVAVPPAATTLVWVVGSTSAGVTLRVNTSGQATASVSTAAGILPSGTVTGSANICDGLTHHIALVHDGSTSLTLYVDGATQGTVTHANNAQTWTTLTTLHVGGYEGGFVAVPSKLDSVLAHVAVYGTALSPTRMAYRSLAGLTGFAGELTDVRLERYAAYAAIPVAEVNAEAGSTTMAHVDTSGKQVVELMRIVEETEGGVLFDDRDGTLTFHNRAHRYNVSSAFTLNMSEHEVESDYAPKLDRTGLLNDVTAANVDNTVTARKTDTASITDYGVAAGSFQTASEDTSEPTSIASWKVATYATPMVRVPSLSVAVLAQVGKTPNTVTVLAANVGTKFTVSGQPTQAPASSTDYFVEGGSESYGPESLTMTFNVSSVYPYTSTWILGDATRGVLGTTTMLAL